ncbi:acyl-ACP--UDP-N-acetylglucosamine O-acyltransferase [Alphaproteobacteria bacterium]|nr:acyl-ACP--UDP-N-acetylglucosamine O-acyltransferase [Alphaproteobacteria bacterium]
MPNIHPTAIIDKNAKINDEVNIGPYCFVGPNVNLSNGVKLRSHVTVGGFTSIGENTEVFPFASIGWEPQDLKYRGEESKLIIGKNNVIREHVTMNPGTEGGGMVTVTGDDCLFMASAHIAHDCKIGNSVILANNATLGGHVEVGDFAFIAGLSAVHQFVRIGNHSMVGGMTGVEYDVIPYGTVTGNRAYLSGLNLVGLKRRGFNRDDINGLRQAYRLLFAQEGTLQERLLDVSKLYINNNLVMDIINFIKSESSRAICQPRVERAT